MNLSALRSVVYDKCGKPTRDEMDDFLIDGWLMSNLAHYNSRLAAVGKPHLGMSREMVVTNRRGEVDLDLFPAVADFTEAAFVRLLVDRDSDTWDTVGVVGNVSQVQDAQMRAQRRIMFYDYPTVKYYLSWKPLAAAGDTLELWFDRDVTELESDQDSPGMPPRFHDLPALRTLHHDALPHLLRPANKGVYESFVRLKAARVAEDLTEREKDFEWWLLGSPSMDGQDQLDAFETSPGDPYWRI